MEKFAVDLDKVLDDFELNEDRAEQLASLPPKKHPPIPTNPRPPPYRRPQFEPINMAEADFAAAPQRPAAIQSNTSWRNQPSSSDDESDGEDSYHIPKNLNENFYENNSFRDEYLYHGNETSWRPNLQDSVNSGGASKIVLEDVKTVVNNLSSNKNKKNEVSESAKADGLLPEPRTIPPFLNNTIPRLTVVSSCETSDEDFESDGERQYRPLETDIPDINGLLSNPDTTSDKSNILIPIESFEEQKLPQAAPVETETKEEVTDERRQISIPEIATKNETEEEPQTAHSSHEIKTEEDKTVITFNEMDHLSDADLLNYLQEIEDEERVKEDPAQEADAAEPSASQPEVVDLSPVEVDRHEIDMNVSLDVECDQVHSPMEREETEDRHFQDVAETVSIPTEEAESNALSQIFERFSEVPMDEPESSRANEQEFLEFGRASAASAEDEYSPESFRTAREDSPDQVDRDIPEDSPESARQPEAVMQVEPERQLSSPGHSRMVEKEDSSPEDEESMEEHGSAVMSADLERPVHEVRTPMVQSPRDGDDIHVLGEEERPTRPKYLLLTNATDRAASGDNQGTAGSTPHSNASVPSVADNEVSDVALDDNRNAIEPEPADTESLDNAANANIVADEELVLTPTPLAPSPASLGPALTPEERGLGKMPPFWVPDQDAPVCMLCESRFTVLKRRHHCRACGKVLCAKCCNLKFHLEYLENSEGRVCQPCYDVLVKVLEEEQGELAGSPGVARRQPNPNNPMEYCSTIPPLLQEAAGGPNPPSVLVPVLKREGSARNKGENAKQVMFSDGIRPGGDLTELDGSAEPRLGFRRPGRASKRVGTPPGPSPAGKAPEPPGNFRKGLPSVATVVKGDLRLEDAPVAAELMATLRDETRPPVTFAINKNLFVNVKIVDLSCCVHRVCWCFSTQGLACVGQDEVMLVLELTVDELTVPVDVFAYFNTLYQDAVKGSTVSDLGCTLLSGPFLGSNEHGAFVYIRPTFQCLSRLVQPEAPYLVAILIHRWEVPWGRVFPLRLALRLGAELRYYPCCLVSVRDRKPVYREVKHTIMNLLADFRNFSYTLPAVRGMTVHMEDRQTSILLPKNRYDQVTRALNNSNEHVLALAANLSLSADSHLVCVQSETDDTYQTQAINIHNKPRKVTGASFIVFNGALKTSSNLTAKSSIVEDGLMVQISPDTMLALRSALREMKDYSVGCGPTGAAVPDEVVNIKWVDDDKHFNVGVRSVIDARQLDGVPSIRVHNGTDYVGHSRLVRWTEVFILQSEEGGSRTEDPLDVGRLSESIARATCTALVNLLDLLAQSDYSKLAVRATINSENVGYEVGSRGEKLPPIYMNSLDNELVPVLHTAAANNENTDSVLELVFHVLRQ